MDRDKMFTAKALLRYYAWRLTKFLPLLTVVLIFAMCVMPFLGAGPIWKIYGKTMDSCTTKWWTVPL